MAVAALVNERYVDRGFTISRLGRELKIAPAVLRRRFRRFYGLPVAAHLASRRLELAELLLAKAAGSAELSRIARLSGYHDAAGLRRDLRRVQRLRRLRPWRPLALRDPSPSRWTDVELPTLLHTLTPRR
ncbi:helix-turn-helix domain-containing protein [Rathayibacter iranicus]|uniref:HTH araC/xylS-type domain-containing protein n=3 Tax=Rathayibacter iranicus TaxID=59737 RepID=A0AAD1ADT0_9MICO|nr:helix-turn-helix domain-containing protein [Rathayibacter iranicus]AZZ56661.1 hypothetical protein C7V51_12835 [Rathayibacter iranicus]MWV31303.1 helix-turn-helix domain-containing protein [Rathayibacter iranicus NCPPB 2253 = VKM Ac-1602]PPI43306.1 hypothetical protein C5E09_11755 [Rathayibacter iranicus]PPI58249.1 hypothetical protein C5E08_12670 [Rathayibacter iranicus]PWJ63652.1 helix-turn-helix protein [Rathayibacter iranicus] [Rathayibacter iranicus NCPPB 2253 = VKM Ac-1602]